MDINENISQYNFGMVLKETMLSLGPTFIKGEEDFLVEVSDHLSSSSHLFCYAPLN